VNPLSATSNSVKFQKTQVQSQLNYFITTGPNGYKTPTSISQRIPNQNLRGYTEGASFIIITHRDLLPAAQRLKTRREAGGPGNPDYLKTYIVECQSIYNEFSGGVLDAAAIRDFIKYAYDNWQQRPVYVLFLGDGDFDYKSILVQDPNWVPAFEISDPNLHQVLGYTTDDFYTQIIGNDPKPDIAHGRVTARSLEEANGYIDKIECYEDASYNGYWKNRCTFVADDGWTTSGDPEGSMHTDQCELLAEQHTPSVFEKAKLYLVAYPIVITSQGRRKPGVNIDIVKHVNAGSMMLHYTGHGSPDVWAHEYVYEKEVAISQMKNKCRYTFLSVASCDHTKFDNPVSQSGGEVIVMTPNKGAIGSLAATRPVYAGQNSVFVNTFYDKLMYPRDTLLLQTRFGKAVFLTKQEECCHSVNDLKYMLICDPTVRVQIPRFRSKIDSISGLSNDTMRALSRIKIYGSVTNPDSSLWASYNGKIFLKIFDVTRNIDIIDEYGIHFRYKLPGGIIFSGTQSVTNGRWSVEYIVPKDISYQNQNGKLIDYFYNSQADGSGEYTNFIVGGIDPFAPIDTIGPDIRVYLNTRNFRSGDIVNENFKLISDFFDESGINTTGTIGHKIEAVLDDNVNNKYDLTSFYNSDTTYKSGSLEYDFLNIPEGGHVMRLKAWDTYNNSSEVQINFNVSTYSSLKVLNIYNYPNPFKDNTTFTFQHNYPNAINVKIKIYTVAGRLIKEISQNNINDKFVTINWPGKDEDGEVLGNGIYIYKLIVQAADGSSVTNVGKVAVLK
ncbi:MAG: type IX secretion system sortase PorU, partial [Ignavibacteria bacterium]